MFEATVQYSSSSPQPTVETSTEYIDSLLLTGRHLAKNTGSLASLIKEHSDKSGLDYYVEPTLIEFRTGTNFLDDDGFADWHEAYIDAVGDPLSGLFEERTYLRPPELGETAFEAAVRADVKFQQRTIPDELRNTFVEHDQNHDPEDYRPAAVIPWFYKIQTGSDLKYNEIALSAAEQVAECPIKPCIFTSKEFLTEPDHRDRIMEILASRAYEECFLWVENLSKHETRHSTYHAVADLVQSLSEHGVGVHMYRGDHFATLLRHLGATGTTYGVLYGEDRKEKEEQSDGAPGGRYYYPDVTDFLKPGAAVDLGKESGRPMCECEVCQRSFGDWDGLAQRVRESETDDDTNIKAPLQKHHLRVRWRLIRQAGTETPEESVERIRQVHDDYEDVYRESAQVASHKDLSYLEQWASVLEEFRCG